MNKYLSIVAAVVVVVAGGWWYTSQYGIAVEQENTQLPLENETAQLPALPATCVNGPIEGPNGPEEGAPVITSISPVSGPIGIKVTITGCNLSGFEGDHIVDLVRADGAKITIRGEGEYQLGRGERGTFIEFTIKEPCQQGETVYGDYSGLPSQCKYVALTPGTYIVSTLPWGKKSNSAGFTVTTN